MEYDIKVITKNIREDLKALKKEFGNFRVNVRKEEFAGGRAVDITLRKCSFDLFIGEEEFNKIYDEYASRYDKYDFGLHNLKTRYEDIKKHGRIDVNKFSIDRNEFLNKKGIRLMKAIIDVVEKYNYDNSNSMIDYFDVNYYTDYRIDLVDVGE